jgi:hypothetical protein
VVRKVGKMGTEVLGGLKSMTKLLRKLWNDDCGALIATELLFVISILVIGLIVGLVGLRNAIVSQLTALGDAILALNFGFSIAGLSGCCSATSGTQVIQITEQLTPPICVAPPPTIIDVPPCP